MAEYFYYGMEVMGHAHFINRAKNNNPAQYVKKCRFLFLKCY